METRIGKVDFEATSVGPIQAKRQLGKLPQFGRQHSGHATVAVVSVNRGLGCMKVPAMTRPVDDDGSLCVCKEALETGHR